MTKISVLHHHSFRARLHSTCFSFDTWQTSPSYYPYSPAHSAVQMPSLLISNKPPQSQCPTDTSRRQCHKHPGSQIPTQDAQLHAVPSYFHQVPPPAVNIQTTDLCHMTPLRQSVREAQAVFLYHPCHWTLQ